MSAKPCDVLVTGDVVLDRHIYEGGRSALQDRSTLGTRIVEEVGGAALTQRLIEAIFRADAAETRTDARKSRCALTWSDDLSAWPDHLAASAWFTAEAAPNTKEKFWRVSKEFGYGSAAPQADSHVTLTETRCTAPILVLDDAGDRFRRKESHAHWLLSDPPKWIVLKLAGPIGTGDLWHRLMQCEPEKRLIVLVSAKLLRKGSVRLIRGISWEHTVAQLMAALDASPLRRLCRARHLIVSFEGDGAVWIDSPSSPQRKARVIFDAEYAEGEWGDRIKGKVFGYQTCLTASVAHALASARDHEVADLEPAIERGLAAIRDLRMKGHGSANSDVEGFPHARVANEILHPTRRFASAPVPPNERELTRWSILASLQHDPGPRRPLYGFARQLVIRGESIVAHVPHLHIGKLLTLDRGEMETLRALRQLLLSYRDAKSADKPLSIGVFGKPGSGKSFAVKQLALGVFGEERGWMEFNLSQFDDTRDLIGAFHQVSDRVLQGLIPIVFWDEFDSNHYDWLRFLLAPMQDGRYQENQITHTLGKCVFIFAGGTAEEFKRFGVTRSAEERKKFSLLKVPDFKSRLDGYLNVAGPNRLNPSDVFFPIRRALMIRSQLGCKPDDAVDIDPGLLTALLEFPKYTHGARSLSKVLEPFATARRTSGAPLRQSQLPALNQLSLHVGSPAAFERLCERGREFETDDVVAKLAPAIHETWRELAPGGRWDMSYDELPPETQRSNEAAARRIPSILSLVGLHVVRGGAASAKHKNAALAQLSKHLELLAEEEHKGWMAHLRSEHWQFAERRDDDKRLHDCLRPYHELRETEKEKDRNSVRHYPDFVRRAGFSIAFA